MYKTRITPRLKSKVAHRRRVKENLFSKGEFHTATVELRVGEEIVPVFLQYMCGKRARGEIVVCLMCQEIDHTVIVTGRPPATKAAVVYAAAVKMCAKFMKCKGYEGEVRIVRNSDGVHK